MTDTTLHDCRTVGSNFLRNSAYSVNAVILGFAPHPAAAAKVTLGFEEVIEVWTTETPDDSANEVDWPQVLKAVTRALDDGLQYGNWPWNQPVRAHNPKSA